jgi:hypothetical protein
LICKGAIYTLVVLATEVSYAAAAVLDDAPSRRSPSQPQKDWKKDPGQAILTAQDEPFEKSAQEEFVECKIFRSPLSLQLLKLIIK